MRSHVQKHVSRNQRKEDADGKEGQAYGQAYGQGYAYINRHRDIGVYQIYRTRERKQKDGYEYRTEHKTQYEYGDKFM